MSVVRYSRRSLAIWYVLVRKQMHNVQMPLFTVCSAPMPAWPNNMSQVVFSASAILPSMCSNDRCPVILDDAPRQPAAASSYGRSSVSGSDSCLMFNLVALCSPSCQLSSIALLPRLEGLNGSFVDVLAQNCLGTQTVSHVARCSPQMRLLSQISHVTASRERQSLAWKATVPEAPAECIIPSVWFHLRLPHPQEPVHRHSE